MVQNWSRNGWFGRLLGVLKMPKNLAIPKKCGKLRQHLFWKVSRSLILNLKQGSPGISEITQGRFFFLSHPGHPPSPGPKTDMSDIFRENIYRFGICSKKNIYGFRIYHKNIVYSSMPCVVSLLLVLSTPVKPYVDALCLQRSSGG